MNSNVYLGYQWEEYVTMTMDSMSREFIVPEQEKFYHYTSVDAVRSMLQHKNQTYTMWASHLSFLNDSEEFENGEKLIFTVLEEYIKKDIDKTKDAGKFSQIVQKFIKAAKNADKDISIDGEIVFNRNIYILCFCLAENSLNQWKYYGKDSGIALEFNLQECNFSGMDCNNPNKDMNIKPYKVIYKDDVKRDILKKAIDNARRKFLSGSEDRERNLLNDLANIYGMCPLFKHEDFEDEKECRLIFRPLYGYSDNSKDVRTLVKYRNRAGILLPYMEIKMHTDAGCTDPVIKNIIIGPGENQELLYKSMRHFIIHAGVFDKYMKEDYSNIQDVLNEHIKKSATPFRG